MTINEAYVEWFEKPMREYIKTEPKEVIDYVQENPDSLVIKERVIGIDEVKQPLNKSMKKNVKIPII